VALKALVEWTTTYAANGELEIAEMKAKREARKKKAEADRIAADIAERKRLWIYLTILVGTIVMSYGLQHFLAA